MSAQIHVSLGGSYDREVHSAERRRTLLGSGGIAHAQSLKSDPREAAKWTVSSDSSVVPTQIIYDPVNAVTCSAKGGSDGCSGATYFVRT